MVDFIKYLLRCKYCKNGGEYELITGDLICLSCSMFRGIKTVGRVRPISKIYTLLERSPIESTVEEYSAFTRRIEYRFYIDDLTPINRSTIQKTLPLLRKHYTINISIVRSVSENITHYICEGTDSLCELNTNYLKALLQRKYVVPFRFYEDLFEEFRDEKEYLIEGDQVYGRNFAPSLIYKPFNGLLLDGIYFTLKLSLSTHINDAMTLIKLGGGSIDKSCKETKIEITSIKQLYRIIIYTIIQFNHSK